MMNNRPANFFRNGAWHMLSVLDLGATRTPLMSNWSKRMAAQSERAKRGPQVQNPEYYAAVAKRVARAKRSPKVRKNRQHRDAMLNAYPGHIEDKLRLVR